MCDVVAHGTHLTPIDPSLRPTERASDDEPPAHDILDRDGSGTAENGGELPGHSITPIQISKSLTVRLYTSHFLSTWNSRLFEAAVVYFLATIFPDNLLPISVYALTRNVAAIALTVPAGNWIDRANRLTIVRTSIIGQRVAVAASCGLFWVMLRQPLGTQALDGLFAAAVILACVEKLYAGVNLVSVERDWVVVITEGNEAARRRMNARMRRIDLFCKLLGPLTIALIAAASVPAAVYSTLGMNLASVLVEYLCIETVILRSKSCLVAVDNPLNTSRYSAGFQISAGRRTPGRQRPGLVENRAASTRLTPLSDSDFGS
jgi:iron-regulated transporter 1